MAALPTYFEDFLREVRPTKNQRDEMRTGHTTLRERLHDDTDLAPIIVSSFLQGSYRRSTAVRPKNGSRSDVDVIVVTRLSKDEYSPEVAMGAFIPFLEKYYKGKWQPQGRSFGIEMSYVDLDLVITAAPSESQLGILQGDAVTTDEDLAQDKDWRLVEGWLPPGRRLSMTFTDNVRFQRAMSQPEWQTEPLWIPDREANVWDETDPLAQIVWTRDKNKACNGYYLGVVQALKWWRRSFDTPSRPKGYPLEHLVGACCPDGTSSVAEGVVASLETITSLYAVHAALGIAPELPDHGVPEHNVMARVNGADFAEFHSKAKQAAEVAREAFNDGDTERSALLWRDLFGSKFPEPPGTSGQKGGYTERTAVSGVAGGRFA
jgi:hypothetical protein